jgi:hypothetical protein
MTACDHMNICARNKYGKYGNIYIDRNIVNKTSNNPVTAAEYDTPLS